MCVIPFKLLKKILQQDGIWKIYLDYTAALLKARNCQQRILFLKKCLSNDLIPRFLKFRIPENGCFEATMFHNFQRRLLRREVSEAHRTMIMRSDQLPKARQILKAKCTDYLLLSVAWHSRMDTRAERLTIHAGHKKNLWDRTGKTLEICGNYCQNYW